MQTKIKPADVQEGMTVLQHGYQWKVKSNIFDPHGNTGNQPRYIIKCDVIGNAPHGYAKDMSLGYLVDEVVTVLEAEPQSA